MFNILVGIKTFMDTNNGQYFKKNKENVKRHIKTKDTKILKNEGMATKTEEQYSQKHIYKSKKIVTKSKTANS